MRSSIFLFCLLFSVRLWAQEPDKIYAPSIHNVKLNYTGNPLQYPIIKINLSGQLDLGFDDLDGGIRSYSYTWQLCNADWSKTTLTEFDYIKGFAQNRITNYRNSSIALTKYTHYMASLPEANCMPSRSGNYLLKVYFDGDTSNLIFSRRVLVEDDKCSVATQIKQTFDGQTFKTHQKLLFNINLGNTNLINPMQQIKVCILQNNRWDNALCNLKPTFIRQNILEYNTEDAAFPGGREWRWLDLRSFRLLSDRVSRGIAEKNKNEIFLKPDLDRSTQRLVLYTDRNGMYYNVNTESLNDLWQTDYALTHFTFVPAGNLPLPGKDVYLFGELTGYGLDDNAKMVFNNAKGVYETDVMLKNGVYDYCYVSTEAANPGFSFDYTEGNFWDTENNYTILVYYTPINGRSDELIGVSRINSLTAKN